MDINGGNYGIYGANGFYGGSINSGGIYSSNNNTTPQSPIASNIFGSTLYTMGNNSSQMTPNGGIPLMMLPNGEFFSHQAFGGQPPSMVAQPHHIPNIHSANSPPLQQQIPQQHILHSQHPNSRGNSTFMDQHTALLMAHGPLPTPQHNGGPSVTPWSTCGGGFEFLNGMRSTPPPPPLSAPTSVAGLPLPSMPTFNAQFNSLNSVSRHGLTTTSQNTNNGVLGKIFASPPPKTIAPHLTGLQPQNLQFIGPPPIADWSASPLGMSVPIGGTAPTGMANPSHAILAVGHNHKTFIPPQMNDNRSKMSNGFGILLGG